MLPTGTWTRRGPLQRFDLHPMSLLTAIHAGGRSGAQSKVSHLLLASQTKFHSGNVPPVLQGNPASEEMLSLALLVPFSTAAEQGWLKTPLLGQCLHWQPLPVRLPWQTGQY